MARHTEGFSTVEVMVALIVLGVGLLGTLATTALTTRLIGEARTRDRAALIAGARVESERSQAASGCAALKTQCDSGTSPFACTSYATSCVCRRVCQDQLCATSNACTTSTEWWATIARPLSETMFGSGTSSAWQTSWME